MQLDIPTLTVAGGFVAVLSALLLAGAWIQNRRATALLWWAGGTLLNATGIVLLVVGGTSRVPLFIAIGIGFFTISPALVWGGVRRFSGRSAPVYLLAFGPIVWLVFSLAPIPNGTFLANLASFLPTIVYLSAAIAELWRGRGEVLPARWFLVGMFGLQILTFLGGIVDSISGKAVSGELPALNSWFGIVNFESLLYSIGTAVFMVLLAKERQEQGFIAASRQDSLTGIANRGALLDSGERLLHRCQQNGMSFSLIIFDLDRFKRVNDAHGHGAGDEVIRTFARTALAILRPNDLLGRYGGEEFVVVLPGATIEAAYVIADRIRNGFATATVDIGDTPVSCTVSAGVASAGSAAVTLEGIIKVADACLYRAKANGRNRVERSARMVDQQAIDNVIRVA